MIKVRIRSEKEETEINKSTLDKMKTIYTFQTRAKNDCNARFGNVRLPNETQRRSRKAWNIGGPDKRE